MKVTIKFYNRMQKHLKKVTHINVDRVEYTDCEVKIIFSDIVKRVKIIYNKSDIFTVMEEYDTD